MPNEMLMGFTADRQKWAGSVLTHVDGDRVLPWFASKEYSNGFPGAVPIEAVEELFAWEALSVPLTYEFPTTDVSDADGINEAGNPYKKVVAENKRAIIRSDTGALLNVTSDSYRTHQYMEWLVDGVANILDSDVTIDSAGLGDGGGVAWVNIAMPDTIETDPGLAIRPGLLACTSHNSKFPTTIKESMSVLVCDNQIAAALRSDDKMFKTKHTAKSHLRINDAREALGILHKQTEVMVDFINKLSRWEVENKQFKSLMNELHPVPTAIVVEGKVTNKRSITNAEKLRAEIAGLYVRDDSAAPWKGTALGVLQAFNTWDQQVKDTKSDRVERKMLGTLGGDVARFDGLVLDKLAAICDVDMRELVTA